MRWKPLPLLAGVACLAWPSVASACWTSELARLWAIPQKFDLGAGLLFQPGEGGGEATQVFSASAAFKLGAKASLGPLVGMCKSGSYSATLFGAGAGFNVWNDNAGKIGINVQTGLNYLSDEGSTDIIIPVGAVAEFKPSDKLGFAAGAGMMIDRFSVDAQPGFAGFSETDTDPFFYGGAIFKMTALDIYVGGVLKMGEGGTDTALNAAIRLPIGK